MAYTEPPPVYSSLSSLSENDKIYFRAEEKKKSLWLSPFTARREPKKFALFHLTASSILFIIAVAYVYSLNSISDSYAILGRYNLDVIVVSLILFTCVPPLPLFLSALYGIKKNGPNFLLPIAIYMLIGFFILGAQLAVIVIATLYEFTTNGPDAVWGIFLSCISLGATILPLFYTCHAARLYLRVRVDILEEQKERQEEKKVPLIV